MMQIWDRLARLFCQFAALKVTKNNGGAGNTADAAVCASLNDCGTFRRLPVAARACVTGGQATCREMPDCGRASRCLSPGCGGMFDRFGGQGLTADAAFAARDFPKS
jgi:hypothetical protein